MTLTCTMLWFERAQGWVAETALVTIAACDLGVLPAKQPAKAVLQTFILHQYFHSVVCCACGQHRAHMLRQQLHGQVQP